MENEVKEKRPYRIMPNDYVYIKRSDYVYNGETKVSYRAKISVNENGSREMYEKPIRFRKGVDLPNGSKIILKDFFETCRHKDKFNDEFAIFVLEYEIADDSSKSEAINEYHQEVEENDYSEEEVIF